jgi:hypothetical protein
VSRHFAEDDVVDADDGYHHYGPEAAVPACDRVSHDAPATVVRVTLKSWTHPLGAEPGRALIEINIGSAAELSDACAEITPGQARAVARPWSSSRTLPSIGDRCRWAELPWVRVIVSAR